MFFKCLTCETCSCAVDSAHEHAQLPPALRPRPGARPPRRALDAAGDPRARPRPQALPRPRREPAGHRDEPPRRAAAHARRGRASSAGRRCRPPPASRSTSSPRAASSCARSSRTSRSGATSCSPRRPSAGDAARASWAAMSMGALLDRTDHGDLRGTFAFTVGDEAFTVTGHRRRRPRRSRARRPQADVAATDRPGDVLRPRATGRLTPARAVRDGPCGHRRPAPARPPAHGLPPAGARRRLSRRRAGNGGARVGCAGAGS